MILTSKGRYAVESVVEMARLSQGNPVPLSLIIKNQQKSFSYLEQLFSQLKKAEIIGSVKGPGGGYVFLKKLEEIKIYDIIVAVEESIKMTKCSKSQNCFGKNTKCHTHKLWKGLENNIKDYFNSITIYDLKIL